MIEDNIEAFQTIEFENIAANQKRGYPNITSVFYLFLAFVGYSLIIGISAGLLKVALKGSDYNTTSVKALISLLGYTITLLLTIRYAIRRIEKHQGDFKKIEFISIQLWLVPFVIIGACALIIPMDQASAWIPMPQSVKDFFENMFSKNGFSILTMVVVAPIFEEILCRGIVLRWLLQRYSPWKAIITSALFFGILHLNPWQAIPAFLGGLYLGWIYYKTRSVIPGMIIHATINITAMSLLFLPTKRQDFLSWWGVSTYVIACFISILIFAVVCFIINKKLSNISISNNEVSA